MRRVRRKGHRPAAHERPDRDGGEPPFRWHRGAEVDLRRPHRRDARRRAGEPEEHSGLSLRLLLRRFLYEKVFAHPRARAADVLNPRFSGRLRRAGQGPRRRERHRRQREGGPARGAHGVPAAYRLPAHAQRAFLHQRGPSGSKTVRNFNR